LIFSHRHQGNFSPHASSKVSLPRTERHLRGKADAQPVLF
jgi:hypothetical protein